MENKKIELEIQRMMGTLRRILYISSSSSLQGGAERCMVKMAKHFNNDEYKAYVVLPEDKGIAQKYRESIINLNVLKIFAVSRKRPFMYQIKYFTFFLFSIINLYKLIKREKIDIVHVNEINDFHALIAGELAGVHTICHDRAIVERPKVAKKIFVFMLNLFADRVICVSKAVKEQMFIGENIALNKIHVIYDGGPDLKQFTPAKYDKRQLRKEFGLSNDDFVVGFVSKFVEVKGQEFLVRAAKIINDQGLENIKYIFVGDKVKSHEYYYNRIKGLIKRYQLENQFIFADYRDDIPNMLNLFDLVVHLPIYEDPFPGVVLEAMAMEKPIIAFESGGIPEQFENGKSGVIVPKGDESCLAASMIDLYEDDDQRQKIGINARKYLLSNFSLDRHFSELGKVYDSLLRR